MTTATQYSPDYWNDHIVDDPDERDAIERAITRLSPTLIAFAERALAESAIAPGSTVIDVGTQFGTVAVVLARAGMRILATDVSTDMINASIRTESERSRRARWTGTPWRSLTRRSTQRSRCSV
jgi:2-polyprenyl-3-methyl-5-hydroxy-6-metoxy-1,4-benzoquinol methylase